MMKWPFQLEALAVSEDHNVAYFPPERPDTPPVGSTPLEREVARLLVEGAFDTTASPTQQAEVRALGEIALEDYASRQGLTVEELRQYIQIYQNT